MANGDAVEHEHPELGPVRQFGPIAQLRETPGSAGGPAPGVGAHSSEIRAEPKRPRSRAPAVNARASSRPLDGVIVLELSTIIAAPLGASMLADLGARVIKIEAIRGDPYRQIGGPQLRGLPAAHTNQGKESICVDLKTPEGQAIVHRLVRGSNALIHNYRPGVPERLGIGWEQLRALRPDLVWVTANGYGPDCPGAGRPATHPIPGASMGRALAGIRP